MGLKIFIKHPKFIFGVGLIVLFVASFFFTIHFLYYTKNNTVLSASNQIIKNTNENTTTTPITGLEKLDMGLPVRLRIPEININSVVESVGLTPDGAMDVPKKQENVAWFNLGQRPGEIGNAVIDGHYGWKNSKPSIFDDLYKLRVGDKIFVEDDKGLVISFIVRGSRRYDKDSNAPEVFVSKDDKSHLNLITCDGQWDKVSKSYPTRLVVFADKE